MWKIKLTTVGGANVMDCGSGGGGGGDESVLCCDSAREYEGNTKEEQTAADL